MLAVNTGNVDLYALALALAKVASQGITSGHLGVHNLMPEDQTNKLYAKKLKTTTHLSCGSYVADLCWV